MLGTIVNSVAIVIGGAIGMLLKKGLPKKIADTLMIGLGLCNLQSLVLCGSNGDCRFPAKRPYRQSRDVICEVCVELCAGDIFADFIMSVLLIEKKLWEKQCSCDAYAATEC